MEIADGERRKRFGRELYKLRRSAGVSQVALGLRVGMSQSAVSQVQNGLMDAQLHHVQKMDAVLGTGSRLRDLWGALYGGYQPPEFYSEIPAMERRSSQIMDYQSLVVTGLLQTRAYASAMIRAVNRLITDDEVEARVQERMNRQEILDSDGPPQLIAVLDELVLQRRLGSPEIMCDQLKSLIEASHRPRVEVLVIPRTTWNAPGVDGSFRLLRLPDVGLVLYRESGETGGVIIKPDIIDEHAQLMADLRAVAHPPDQSRSLLETLQGEFR
ncbi:helix-turn-helix domain-containing protein [Nocardiopsis coralliicola]